jgi:hypothetical protein
LQRCFATSCINNPGTYECPEHTIGGGDGIGGITTLDDDDKFFRLASMVANDSLKYGNTEAYPLHIVIMDALGRTTSNTTLNSSPAVLSSEISNLATGVYFYKIIDNANTIVKQDKLIKQ